MQASSNLVFSLSLCACHLSFSFFLSLDLGLDCLPFELNLLVQLLEPIESLLFAVLLKEALSVGQHGVKMSLLRDGNVQCFVPLVKLDVHLDGSVEETRTEEDLLSFRDLLTVE